MSAFFFDTPFAKINLTLRLMGKRKDGYNNLHTVFYRIGLADELLLIPHPSQFTIVCNAPNLRAEDNILTRAFLALKMKTRLKQGVTAFLSKKIPLASGLGGASSDAASFLKGMNQLYRLGLSQSQLIDLGAQVGADVPFFITGWQAALGTGIGENLRKLNIRNNLWIILVLFDRGLSTKTVFGRYQYLPNPPSLTRISRDVRMLCRNFKSRKISALSPSFLNDLQPISMSLHSGIGKAMQATREVGLPVSFMSGSGPTVVSFARTKQEALDAVKKLRRHLTEGRVEMIQAA